ncbi:hypothetical protein [Thioalkalivibrio sp. ALE16]|uniref:hypothetical protein n=1 Tax=Thioalkalivibrio sp. ALE16 TaxID=1158172 RepID=UPI000361733C|nr:hypothetical protein [Thioalkalivibrio sp. ALE16]
MGGNAVTSTTRLTSSELMVLAARVQRALSAVLPEHHQSEPVRFHSGKRDHGDFDVLVACDDVEYVDGLGEALNASECKVNRPKKGGSDPNRKVTSYSVLVGHKPFQVDVVQVPESAFSFARWYFAFNDLGNLLGRVARRLGFKLSESGLWCEVDADGERVGEVAVTRDWDEALTFLGYDSDRYWAGVEGGFDSLESLFEFVASSPHFNPAPFRPENRSSADRRRDAMRPTYQAFLAWLDQQGSHLPVMEACDEELLRVSALTQAARDFPLFSRGVSEMLDHHRRMKSVHQRFNGRVVSDATGLVGSDLGAFLRAFRERMGSERALAEWVESRSDSDVGAALAVMAKAWRAQVARHEAEAKSGVM